MLDNTLVFIKKFIPKKLFATAQPAYHWLLAFFGALFYRFPSRRLKVIAVTGTKGKTTVVELANAILEEAGYATALSSTLRIKIGKTSKPNLRKMTMPGRFFTQRFLKKAADARCDYALIETSSEAAKQFRHKFIQFDALIFTNLAPEHIEAHGSYEAYRGAKINIGEELAASPKKNRVIIVNADDREAERFLALAVPNKFTYSLADAEPYAFQKDTLSLTFLGEKITAHLAGELSIYNILAAARFGISQGIELGTIQRAIEKFGGVPGRIERVTEGQDFDVIVDYAHTPDSLEKIYDTFGEQRKICVLGATGGGRDKWKRKKFGAIAAAYCSQIFLTNEDPYDENPEAIVKDIAKGIGGDAAYEIEMDRRAAIRKALAAARTGDAVILTGKGTDPYIMGPRGEKTLWNEAAVTREELKKLLAKV